MINEKRENICFTFIKLQKWVAILQGEKKNLISSPLKSMILKSTQKRHQKQSDLTSLLYRVQ